MNSPVIHPREVSQIHYLNIFSYFINQHIILETIEQSMVPQSNKNIKCENKSIADTESDDSLLLNLDLNDSTSKRTLSNETSEYDQIKKLKLDDSNVIYNYRILHVITDNF